MKNILSFLFVFIYFNISAQIKLTHNIGNTPIDTGMFSCEDRDEGWSRIFKLSDFGIRVNEQFIIKSGQVALSKSSSGAYLQFNVYSIDENFPIFFYSLYPRTVLGSRGIGRAPIISGGPKIIDVEFEAPIIIPAGTERILVTVQKIVDFYNPASAEVIIAGTEDDTGESWYEGCQDNYSLKPTTELNIPVSNANFYINVTGEAENISRKGSTLRLTHNVCDDIIETNISSCTSTYIYWARTFILKEFGISTNEEFVINSGQVGITKTGWLPEISFNIYKIDENFPTSFSETDLIGSSQYQQLSPNIDRSPQIIQVDFDTPIVIPANVERILVEVHKGIVYGDGVAFIAGSTQDNDLSWQRGCYASSNPNEYASTESFGRPDANFYINISGNVNHVTNNFEMNISNICSEFLKEFSVENRANVASIVWDFGDPKSGINNTSTDKSPYHDFSSDGIYTITANVTANDGSVETLTETIDVEEPPNAYGIDNIEACEDNFQSGISSSFDTAGIHAQVLGGQTNKVVTYIDGSGNEYSTFPNPFTNTVKDVETITVRVSHENNPCCYSETTFDLIINPNPNIESVSDLVVCSNETNGFSVFNLQEVKENIITNSTNLIVTFYHENGNEIQGSLDAVENLVVNEEEITVKVINTNTNCYSETKFKLKTNPIPLANLLTELIGCDDNNDGISEYFDTSNIEFEVLGGQTGMELTYFDINGNLLTSLLPNPYTNIIQYQEQIIVRVTNPITSCYAETPLILKTSTKPQINKPQDIYSCNLDNGFAEFDLSNVENQIVGSQNGLIVLFFDSNGNSLVNSLTSFRNTQPWVQTIHARVENELNAQCYSETSFDLIVNELPIVNIENSYFLCDLEPFYNLIIDDSLDSYLWQYQDGSTISNTNTIKLEKAGSYSLLVSKNINGVFCINNFNFELVRSQLPKIIDVKIKELSDENYIEVFVSGDGDFEYSIDGVNYKSGSTFNNIQGGIYNVSVRDRSGCGEDFQEVILLDYPKYFTPNGDNINDLWQIKGLQKFPNAQIFIYDRYGKLLKQISANSSGWDGSFKGSLMDASDYWFQANLDNERQIIGHFALKR